MKKLITILLLSTVLTSCGTVGSVSSPTEYIDAGKEVSVKKENVNVLGLTAMDAQSKTEEMLNELKNQCTNGVTNVTTTVSFKSILIVYLETLKMSGNCIK